MLLGLILPAKPKNNKVTSCGDVVLRLSNHCGETHEKTGGTFTNLLYRSGHTRRLCQCEVRRTDGQFIFRGIIFGRIVFRRIVFRRIVGIEFHQWKRHICSSNRPFVWECGRGQQQHAPTQPSKQRNGARDDI